MFGVPNIYYFRVLPEARCAIERFLVEDLRSFPKTPRLRQLCPVSASMRACLRLEGLSG
jgi:hypothetical protein